MNTSNFDAFEQAISSKTADVMSRVPKACRGCPGMCDMFKYLAKLESDTDMHVAASMSDEPQEFLAQTLVEDSGLPEEAATAFANKYMQDKRRSVGDLMASMDEEFEEAADNVDHLTDGCPGKLTMRAKNKLGQTVTVVVCSSPLWPTNETGQWAHEQTHVRRA